MNVPQRVPDYTHWFLVAAWRHFLKEPAKSVGLAYLWMSAVGFIRLFAVGGAFGINVVDLASPSDFLVSGLRDPLVVLAAAISGLGLCWMWTRSLQVRWWQWAIVPAAIALLVVDFWGSRLYRRAVIAGSLRNSDWAPVPAKVSFGSESARLDDLRLVVSMADFLVFYSPACEQQTVRAVEQQESCETRCVGTTIVVRRDDVKEIRLRLTH